MKKLILLLLLFAACSFAQTSITHGAGAPAASNCNATRQYGREYMDITPTPPDLYLCGSAGWQKVSGGGGGSGCVPSGSAGQILSDSGAGACTSNTTGAGILTALGINTGSAGAPVLFNGVLGTPSGGTGTNITGLPISTGVSGLGTGIATALAVNTGSAGAPVLLNGAGGTPSSLTLTNATGLVAAGMPNSGVFTGDATTTFPALTIGNAAITAVKMVNAGVFTGDVTTTFPAITVAKVNGIAYSSTAAAHSVEVITTANTTATAKVIPDCTDSSGNHLNYTQSTDAFSCGTTASVGGTVTTVGFTGGLISVANPTTAPALTVAGTSGGIPYFSGAATWASSGAGVQNAMVTWGGAGNAPTSPLSLLVTNQNSNSETWTFYNSTATTGVTKVIIKEGANAAAPGSMLGIQDNSGALMYSFENNNSEMFSVSSTASQGICIGTIGNRNACNAAIVGSTLFGNNAPSGSYVFGLTTAVIGWGAGGGNLARNAMDITLDRDAAGILGVQSGTGGTTAGNYRAVAASAYYSKGTTFTASGCSNGTLAGGATAGNFTVTTGACGGVTITMGNSATAPTGWSCFAEDISTPANLWAQSGGSTTTAILNGTAAGSDVIKFACIGY